MKRKRGSTSAPSATKSGIDSSNSAERLLTALKGEWLEAKPKRVNLPEVFKDEVGALSDARLLLEFNELQDCIHNGDPVPDAYYRLDVGKTKDRLLDEAGVKHLHLGGRGSETVVYLLELEDRVVFLRISDHRYLEDEPRGSLLSQEIGYRLYPSPKK